MIERLHAFCRVKKERIAELDNYKVKDPRKLTPEEKYIRKYTPEGAVLDTIEKDPKLSKVKNSKTLDAGRLKAIDNLKFSGTIDKQEGFGGLVYRINYDKLPELFKGTSGGKLIDDIEKLENGYKETRNSPVRDAEINNLLDSGLLEKGRIKGEDEIWENIVFSPKNSKLKEKQEKQEEEESARLNKIIEKQLKKEKNPTLTEMGELIKEQLNTRPGLSVYKINQLLDLNSSVIKGNIIALEALGSVISFTSEDLGIIGRGKSTKYLFTREYFEDGNPIITPERKAKIISDIEKLKKEFQNKPNPDIVYI